MSAAYKAIYKKFQPLAASYVGGHLDKKAQYHKNARALLKHIADAFKYTEGAYDIRSNLGGPAVSGEITLHCNDLYVQISQYSTSKAVLARTCKDRKDYVGGTNNFLGLEDLSDLAKVVSKLTLIRGR